MRHLFLFIFVLLSSETVNAQGWFDNLKHNATRIYSETRKEISRYGERIKHDYARKKDELTRNLHKNYSEWENKIKEYGSSLSGTVKNIYENPNKLLKYEREIHKKITSGTILAIKNIPVYDPESGRIVSFDEYSKNLVNNLAGGLGGDFANDPVAVTVGIMMDEDYLLKAKIIPFEGKYISVEELSENGFNKKEVNNIYSEYYNLKEQYNSNKASFGKSFSDFTTKLTTLSKKTSSVEIISFSLRKLFDQIQDFYRQELKIRNHDIAIILTFLMMFIMFLIILKIIWGILMLPFRLIKRTRIPQNV